MLLKHIFGRLLGQKARRTPPLTSSTAVLVDFSGENKVAENDVRVFSDEDFGGRSKASVESRDDALIFRGVLNSELPEGSGGGERMQRQAIKTLKKSGFAGFSCSNLLRGEVGGDHKEEGDVYVDVERFQNLKFTVKTDGRTYVVSVKTAPDDFRGGAHDLWQCFLQGPKDEWCEITIPFRKFIRTWKGGIVQNQRRQVLMKDALRSIGVAVNKENGGDGDFNLELAKIEAVVDE